MLNIANKNIEDIIVDTILENCKNYKELCQGLDLPYNSHYYLKLKKYLESRNITTKHFKPLFNDSRDVVLIRKLVKESVSVREVLIKLSKTPSGGNYRSFYNFIDKHQIDISGFLGQASNLHRQFPQRSCDSQQYIYEGAPKITSFKLKNKLIKEGVFERKCYKCGLTEWLGEPIPLELEHKDGDHSNNSYDNLTLFCHNCHALTPTFRRRKSKM